MKLVLILVIATGVLTPVVIALATLGSPLLTLGAVLAALVVEILCVVLWFDQQAEKKVLERRLRLVAAPLSGERLSDDNSEVEVNVFRQRRAKSWLLDRLDRHFSMIDARQALPKAIGLGALGGLAAGLGGLFADFGWLSGLALPVGWLGTSWVVLSRQDAAQRTEFTNLFPEATDHVVRMMRSGLPSVEAISVVAEEAPPPVSTIMRDISEAVSAGLDPETVIRAVAARVRIPEFTLFSAAICLQMTTGGGISGALGNLSATLRTRREGALKAKSSTAQTRLHPDGRSPGSSRGAEHAKLHQSTGGRDLVFYRVGHQPAALWRRLYCGRTAGRPRPGRPDRAGLRRYGEDACCG